MRWELKWSIIKCREDTEDFFLVSQGGFPEVLGRVGGWAYQAERGLHKGPDAWRPDSETAALSVERRDWSVLRDILEKEGKAKNR